MRLKPYEKEAICQAFRRNFANNDHLWLFGSRTDPNKRGGDIDLYPGHPELTADFLNAAFEQGPFLLEVLAKLRLLASKR